MFWPGSQQFWRPLPGCGTPSPPPAAGSLGGQRLAPSPRARCAFCLRGPSARHRLGLRKSSDRNRGPVCWVGGGGFSGAEFVPFPLPAASYLQWGWGGSSLEFLSPFALRTAGGVFWPVNFSLALPQFKKAPSDCSQGLLASPHPKECRRLLSVPPPLAGGGCGRLGYFSAGSCF